MLSEATTGTEGTWSRLVGRDQELARLLTLLDDAASRQAVVALISGDAGVGKTRLVTEVTRRAAGQGFIVLSGHCAELGESVPYLPLADALRSATSAAPAGPRLLEALATRPVLGRLLPEGAPGTADGEENVGTARQQMFGAVLGLLGELSATAPVLLVFEDLHWADASTRDLLTFLSRVLRTERVALIGTYRTDDLHRRHPLRPLAAELQRLPSVTALRLGPLNATALAEHLTALAGLRSGGLDAAELNSIIGRAEGNAYYAEELLAATSGGRGGRQALPEDLAALLLSRVERLSDAAQRVLRAAAVAGRQADDELVRAASGLPLAEYEDAIREAVTQQLLVPDGDGYSFRHALLREAVEADLLPGERTRLHGVLAGLLAAGEQGTPPTMRPGVAAELAHHYLASHDVPGAFAASIQAGREAERLGAPAEAHRHYDQALALWDRVPDAEERGGLGRGHLVLESAHSAAASGDVVRAVHQLRALWASLPPGADPMLVAKTGERLAHYLFQSDSYQLVQEAAQVARAAIDALPEEPATMTRARAIATYASTLLALGFEDEAAAKWAERARAAAQAGDAPAAGADALVTLASVARRDGRDDEAIELYTAAYEQARKTSVLGVELRAATILSRAQLELGELAASALVAHQGVQRADETGLSFAPYGLDVQHLHFQAHYAQGAWDHAQELANSWAVRVATLPEAVLSAMALFIDVARGNAVVAERRVWLEPLWDQDKLCAYMARAMLAEQALWQGDTDLALAETAATIAGDYDEHYGYVPSVIRPVAIGISAHADRAVLARAAGDEARAEAEVTAARTLLDQARQGAAATFRPRAVLGPEGRGWLARAEAEFGRAQGSNDPAAWRTVLDQFGPAFVYEVARTRWRLAEALAQTGDRAAAQEQWDLAAATADELRAAPLRAALTGLARRARLHDPGTGESREPVAAGGAADGAAATLAALTTREREVLRLIAAGRSNREIGAELFISAKTASVHVSNILGKLGVASRTEAAAIAHREDIARTA
ncbi:MAG: AAA family ATPase [Actinobacteria bacterium]|nr:AAA family ATPase [Actinomycetota bacterium]